MPPLPSSNSTAAPDVKLFLLRLWWFLFIFFNYGRLVPMASLTPEQLQQLQNDLDAVKAANTDDTNAQNAITADEAELADVQAQLSGDQAVQVGTAAALVAAEAALFSDVAIMVNPPAAG